MEYSDSTATSTDDPSESPDTDAGAEDQEDPKTGLLQGSLFPKDCKVGNKYTVEVVNIYDDEKEVKVLSESEGDSKPEGSTMDKAKASMDRYAKEPGGM